MPLPSPPLFFLLQTQPKNTANFLAANKCYEKDSSGYKMMEMMTGAAITCLKERTPLSEDMLFIAWKWSAKVEEGGSSKSRIWKTLKETLEKTLVIPLNRRHWMWFKMNLLHSGVKPLSLSFSKSIYIPFCLHSSGLKNLTKPQ